MRPQIRRFFIAVILMYSAAMHHVNAQVRRATATPTTEHIRIDGNPDEPAWQTATPIGALIQVVPKEGAEPTEKTEVRVLVDEEALYFGIICFDRNPSAIITTQLSRDGHLPVDDHFIVALDPFLDPSSITVTASGSISMPQVHAQTGRYPTIRRLRVRTGTASGTRAPASRNRAGLPKW
jgi:hypothetical protein